MSNMFLNSQADEYLMGLRFSGSESKEYEEAHLKWDNPVDYSIFLEKDSNYFKLLKDTEVIDSNYIYNGSSIWAKGITNINIIKLGNPFNKILDSPGYGDEFIGDSLTEERYKEANQYFTTKVKELMSLLEESNFKDIIVSYLSLLKDILSGYSVAQLPNALLSSNSILIDSFIFFVFNIFSPIFFRCLEISL